MKARRSHPFRVAIAGLGIAGGSHWAHLWGRSGVKVVAICRRDSSAARRFSAKWGVERYYTDYSVMLKEEELDGLVIATPHNVIGEHLHAAIGRVQSILVEKPMAATRKEADSIASALSRSKTRVVVGYPRRYRNQWRQAAEWVHSGLIGCPEYGLAQWTDEYLSRYSTPSFSKSKTFRNDPVQAVHGVLLDSGSHLLDAILWVANPKPEMLVAMIREARPQIDIAASIIIKCAAQCLFTATIYPASTRQRTRRFLLQGPDARLEVDDETAILQSKRSRTEVKFKPGIEGPVDDLIRLMRGEAILGCNAIEGIRVVRVLEALYDSASRQAVMPIRYV